MTARNDDLILDSCKTTMPLTSSTLLPPRVAIHELPATSPGATEPHVYRILEIAERDFKNACTALRKENRQEEDTTTILLLKFDLSEPDLAHLPSRTPWLQSSRRVQVELRALRMLLVDPIATRTWPCIDTMDHLAALSLGSELCILRTNAPELTPSLRELEHMLRNQCPARSVLLQVRSPPDQNPITAVEHTVNWLESRGALEGGALVLLSTMPSQSLQYELIAMIVR